MKKRRLATPHPTAATSEWKYRYGQVVTFAAVLMFINIAFCLRIAQVWNAPGYQAAGALRDMLPWAAAVNIVSGLLLLFHSVTLVPTNWLRAIWASDWIASLLPFALVRCLQTPVDRELLGLTYAAFIFLKLFNLVACLLTRWSQLKTLAPISFFVVIVVMYAAMTPWAVDGSWPAGDEPHYLLLTHSLVFDHDFDLTNNYASKHFRAFYPPPDLEPHTVVNSHREQVLFHDPGTSVLLAPGYWAAGRTGATIEVNIAAALLALALFVLACRLGATPLAAFGCSLLYAFSVPLVYFSSQIYPDALGAGCCAWTVVAVIGYMQRRSLASLAVAGSLMAILPWLNIRFWMPVGALCAVIFAHIFLTRRQNRWIGIGKATAAVVVPIAISLIGFAIFDQWYFDTILPNAGYLAIRKTYNLFWFKPQVALLGMLFDRAWGLLPIAPIYILVLAGVCRYSRLKWESVALLAPALAYLGFISLSKSWHGGWCPPGRLILFTTTLLVPFAALVVTERRARWFTLICGLWSIVVSFAYTALPLTRYPAIPDQFAGGLNYFLREKIRIEPGILFPSMMRSATSDYLLAGFWTIVVAVCVWWLNRSPAETRPVPPVRD